MVAHSEGMPWASLARTEKVVATLAGTVCWTVKLPPVPALPEATGLPAQAPSAKTSTPARDTALPRSWTERWGLGEEGVIELREGVAVGSMSTVLAGRKPTESWRAEGRA